MSGIITIVKEIIELSRRDKMNRSQLINHLRVILRIHEIDEQENNFLYWELKSTLEELD